MDGVTGNQGDLDRSEVRRTAALRAHGTGKPELSVPVLLQPVGEVA